MSCQRPLMHLLLSGFSYAALSVRVRTTIALAICLVPICTLCEAADPAQQPTSRIEVVSTCAADDNIISVWSDGTVAVTGFQKDSASVAFQVAPKGRYVFAEGGKLLVAPDPDDERKAAIHDTGTGRVLWTQQFPEYCRAFGPACLNDTWAIFYQDVFLSKKSLRRVAYRIGLWNLRTNQRRSRSFDPKLQDRISIQSDTKPMAISPDSKRFAIALNNREQDAMPVQSRLLVLSTEKGLQTVHDIPVNGIAVVNSIAFSSDGKEVALGGSVAAILPSKKTADLHVFYKSVYGVGSAQWKADCEMEPKSPTRGQAGANRVAPHFWSTR